MAKMFIYPDGGTSGGSFQMVSSWTVDSSGTKFTSGPTTAWDAVTFPLDALPAGSRNVKATVYAKIGSRFTANTGTASGYPKANGVKFIKLVGADDPTQHIAEIEFDDVTASIRVAFSFKANGNKSKSGKGSLSFDDVKLEIDYTPPASDFVFTSQECIPEEIPLEGKILITEDNYGLFHRVVVTSNDETMEWTQDARQNDASDDLPFSIDFPLSWASHFPAAKSALFDAVVYTYSDSSRSTLLGTMTKSFTMSIPDFLRPEAGTISVSYVNDFHGLCIPNKTQVTFTGEGWSGDGYGSAITDIEFECDGFAYVDNPGVDEIQSGRIVLGPIVFPYSGIKHVSLKVTDSRGNTAYATLFNPNTGMPGEPEIYVENYNPVMFNGIAQGRCDSTGTPKKDGTDIYVRASYTYTPLYSNGITNTPRISVVYESTDGETYPAFSASNYISGSTVVVSNGNADMDQSYKLIIGVSDGITTAYDVRTISSGYVYMRWEPKSNAIGFGCYPTKEKCVQVADDWELIAKNIIIDGQTLQSLQENIAPATSNIVVSATQPENPVNGMIWLDIS